MTRYHVPIRIGPRSRLVLLLFGVQAGNAWVELDGELEARFGFFHLVTPVSNLVSWRIEGPWRWITAIGVRRSIRHGDVTFGGNADGGLRVDFRDPVRWGPFRVPALYVTVSDLDGLARALTERGVPAAEPGGQRA